MRKVYPYLITSPVGCGIHFRAKRRFTGESARQIQARMTLWSSSRAPIEVGFFFDGAESACAQQNIRVCAARAEHRPPREVTAAVDKEIPFKGRSRSRRASTVQEICSRMRTPNNAACVLSLRSSLVRILLTCVRTVFSLTHSSAAISWFCRPRVSN